MMNRSAFSFFDVPLHPPKPRKVGMCIATERWLPPGFIADFLYTYHDIVDWAKMVDHYGIAGRYTEDYWYRKLGTYHRYGIKVEIGGVTFELAYLQGKVKEYFETAKRLGFDGVEVSDDIITPLDNKTRTAMIEMARATGLEVVTEIGMKEPGPNRAFDVREAIYTLEADIKAGASRVTVENADTVILKEKDPQALVQLAENVGLEKLVFEVGPGGGRLQGLGTWLINLLGSDINIQNLDLGEECVLLDSIRAGFGRDARYAFFKKGARTGR